MYRCPACWQDFLTRFEPCPGCSAVQAQRTRAQRAKERRHAYDPVGQIHRSEFWAIWRLYPHCPCCGSGWGAREHISLDHIVPLAQGGPNIGENVQPLCQRCNLWKSDHIIYFDRAFTGQPAAIPGVLWSYLPAKPAPAEGQISLLTLTPVVDLRFPAGTPRQFEQATLELTRQAQLRTLV
ncbi:HNH endonuclease signature motif containing protein [Anthocerotibacter panamensis]|uniref:HNH endonuclease signature motif containing protein n=1 Tax=Anthocerotibacter panamensis TaxID=2857077 RepID=UPI001C4021EB|nr:HNH endonuclease signature motif containing protein [Anthocerotibacter panamensis]